MTYLTAQEALEYGLIDRVLSSRKDLPGGGAVADLPSADRNPSGIG
jgi:ATP-dependent Clp protease, protease subunit